MAVARVFAEAGVHNDGQFGDRLFNGPYRTLCVAFGMPRFAADLVLLVGKAEYEDCGNAQLRSGLGFLDDLVGGQVKLARQRRDLFADAFAWHDEERVDEVAWGKCGLADHAAKRFGATQATRTSFRERHAEGPPSVSDFS